MKVHFMGVGIQAVRGVTLELTPHARNSMPEPEAMGGRQNKRQLSQVQGVMTSVREREEGSDMTRGQDSRGRFVCFYFSG